MSRKYAPGKVFCIPFLNGGYGFGVITFYVEEIGLFSSIYDYLGDSPKPPADLADKPFILEDSYGGMEFMIRPKHVAQRGAKWTFTKLRVEDVAPKQRWYLMGSPPRSFRRTDIFRELPDVPLSEEEAADYARMETRFPPYRAAAFEVAIKRLDQTPEALIEAWQAEQA